MTIRRKILLGCLALTALTALLGGFTLLSQRRLGGLAGSLYDDAFLAMSYLRSSQHVLSRASATIVWGGVEEDVSRSDMEAALDFAGNELGVALERALSPAGREAVAALAGRVAALSAAMPRMSPRALDRALIRLAPAYDAAVEIYAADAYARRRSATRLIVGTGEATVLLLALSLAAALAITLVLARSIVPPIRRAVEVADAVAAGRLDHPIAARGSDEAARLLRALANMQASLRALMAARESRFQGEIALRESRFEAALSNMVQGLCLFGPDGRLLVANRRFGEMFGEPAAGAGEGEVFAPEALSPLRGAPSGEAELEDGRVFRVVQRPVEAGGRVVTYEDVTERRRAEARLVHMAHHDSLTGLPNRVLFREHLGRALLRGRGTGHLAVLCLDLDRFKAVNDTLGHPVGDALLRAVAQRLLGCARESDVVVRLGGDEFALVQEGGEQPRCATVLARRVVEALSQPFEIEGHHVVVGASVGIALSGEATEGPEGSDALLKSADLALYRAKAEGRGTWRFFEAEMDARMRARRLLEMDLRRALGEGQLEPFYQPVVDAASGRVSGFEALMRWRHPERGLVSPGAFIPLAEEIGLIRPLGAWMLRRACADAARWPDGIKVAVNLSPAQFVGPALVGEVAEALAEAGLAPGRLELEITESLLLRDDEQVLATLHALRGLGVRIAMDDFGTGYSSLSYLRRFPFDKIKIDQSFVRGLGEDADCAAIVRAVVGLGRSLGMAVNAEGVETPEQLAALRAEGCGELQGYLFSRPRPAAEVSAMLAEAEAGAGAVAIAA